LFSLRPHSFMTPNTFLTPLATPRRSSSSRRFGIYSRTFLSFNPVCPRVKVLSSFSPPRIALVHSFLFTVPFLSLHGYPPLFADVERTERRRLGRSFCLLASVLKPRTLSISTFSFPGALPCLKIASREPTTHHGIQPFGVVFPFFHFA